MSILTISLSFDPLLLCLNALGFIFLPALAFGAILLSLCIVKANYLEPVLTGSSFLLDQKLNLSAVDISS